VPHADSTTANSSVWGKRATFDEKIAQRLWWFRLKLFLPWFFR
jgi:hypothetical protein